jgi:hypothetical protein
VEKVSEFYLLAFPGGNHDQRDTGSQGLDFAVSGPRRIGRQYMIEDTTVSLPKPENISELMV